MAASPIPSIPVIDDVQIDPQAGVSILQVITILRAHWKKSLLIWLAVTAVSAVTLKLLPKTYTAMATLIVDTNQKDPLAGQEFPVNLLNNYVATQTELMQGPVILLPVIDRLDLTHDKEFSAGFRGDENAHREYVERNLSNSLQVDQGRGGQLLYVSVSAQDPVKAANIANAVTDVYLEQERRRVNVPAGERAQRYSEQIAELRAKVATAQEKIAAFRQQKGITEVATTADADNPDTETQALTNLETHLLDAQNLRRSLEAKLAGKRSSTDEAMTSPQVQQLQTQLRSLEGQKAQLAATYGVKHPKFLEVKSQIAIAQHALDAEMSKLGDNNATELSRARALEAQYARAVEEQRGKVLRLRDVQGEGGKLMLELQSAEAVYKRALDGYDQIMFASVGDYKNVTIVSRATPPSRASKPNKLKLLILGCFAGLGLGLAAPFLYELFLDRRLRCRDDLERSFGIPVLMQFEPIQSALERI
jgi:uncharacterized protein involved in exopolysaccharide biosynthesis